MTSTLYLAGTVTKSFSVTGLPALLIIVAVLAILIGFGVWIGRRRRKS